MVGGTSAAPFPSAFGFAFGRVSKKRDSKTLGENSGASEWSGSTFA
jgi:hypothetical protein